MGERDSNQFARKEEDKETIYLSTIFASEEGFLGDWNLCKGEVKHKALCVSDGLYLQFVEFDCQEMLSNVFCKIVMKFYI